MTIKKNIFKYFKLAVLTLEQKRLIHVGGLEPRTNEIIEKIERNKKGKVEKEKVEKVKKEKVEKKKPIKETPKIETPKIEIPKTPFIPKPIPTPISTPRPNFKMPVTNITPNSLYKLLPKK